jgi:hypothetical protein
MNSARSLVVAVAIVLLGGQVTSAQDTSRYRLYVLDSSLDTVVAASGARAADAKTLYDRPATIQELQWRAPYVGTGATLADPVRDIVFSFYNGALYQVVVNYDRERTEGLTSRDIINSLSADYGVPAAASTKTGSNPPPDAVPDSLILARWESPTSLLVLVRGRYEPEYRLLLISKDSSTRARGAIREAIRLNALEAPRREAEQRTKDASDASAARGKTRDTNKAAFRP